MLKMLFDRILITLRQFILLVKTKDGQKSIARSFDNFFLDASKAESRIKDSIISVNNISSIVQFIASIGLMRFMQISLDKIDTKSSIFDRISIFVLNIAISVILIYALIRLSALVFDYIVYFVAKNSVSVGDNIFRMEYLFLTVYFILYLIGLNGMNFIINGIAMSMF